MNGHIIGFRPQTQKVESPYKTPSSTLAVKGLGSSHTRITFSEQRDQTMPQVVAYKSMKTMENSETVKQKSSCGRFREVVVLKGYNCSDLAEKMLVLLIGGCLWKVVEHGRSIAIDYTLSRLYTKGAFQKSELDCLTMAEPVILTSNKLYPRIFAEKLSPSCTLFMI